MIKNFYGHLKNIIHHKWIVFGLCCKVGIPFRGLVHDLSKFSYTEFWQGVTYYQDGKRSPIQYAKQDYGYSKAWLHHKGRNKHHPEYWYDPNAPVPLPIIPFPYACEMICDQLAAGKVYQGKKWTKQYQLTYWEKHKDSFKLNEKLKQFVTEVFTEVAENGIRETMTKENLKQSYNRCVNSKGEKKLDNIKNKT